MNPFAAIPIEERYAEFHKRYPALNLIGNTRLVEILCFKEEFPEVKIYAKAEYRYSQYDTLRSSGVDVNRNQVVAGLGVRF